MKNQTDRKGHKTIGKVSHPTRNATAETAENPCILLGWSTAVTFWWIDQDRYVIAPKEISMPAATRDIAAAVGRMVDHGMKGRVEPRTVLQVTGKRFADLLTEWVLAEDCHAEMQSYKSVAGMVLYFVHTIHHEPQLSLHEREIQQLIDHLPVEALEFASQEALDFLQVHGFRSISRKIIIASQATDVFLVLQGSFAERPEPSLAKEPITHIDVSVRSLDYGKSRATLSSSAAGNLIVNVEERLLLDKLHAAGLEGNKLMCTAREVLAAQNRKELQLLNVQLQPHQP